MTDRSRERGRELQGKRAGFVSRISAAAIDIATVFAVYFLLAVAWGAVKAFATENTFVFPRPPAWFSGAALLALLVLALAATWAGAGRTLGNAAVGIRVVTETGQSLTFPRAAGRAAVLVLLPFVSMGWILVSRKNAGLHDLVCHTTVIYDWRPRRERVGSPAPPAVPEPVESRQN